MNFLRRFSIRTRIAALVILCLASIIGVSADRLYSLNSSILHAKKETIRLQTDSAYSIVKELYELSEQGKMDTQQAQKLAKQTLASMRYDGNYFYISDVNGFSVMHPIKSSFDGADLSGLKDPNGVALVQDIIKVAKNNEKGGFSYYQWPKLKDEKPVDKASYNRLFKPWGWIISTGIYLDEVQEEFFAAATQTLITSAIFIALLLLVAGFILRSPLDS